MAVFWRCPDVAKFRAEYAARKPRKKRCDPEQSRVPPSPRGGKLGCFSEGRHQHAGVDYTASHCACPTQRQVCAHQAADVSKCLPGEKGGSCAFTPFQHQASCHRQYIYIYHTISGSPSSPAYLCVRLENRTRRHGTASIMLKA